LIIKLKNQNKEAKEELKEKTLELDNYKKNFKITKLSEMEIENKILYHEIDKLKSIIEKSNKISHINLEDYEKYRNFYISNINKFKVDNTTNQSIHLNSLNCNTKIKTTSSHPSFPFNENSSMDFEHNNKLKGRISNPASSRISNLSNEMTSNSKTEIKSMRKPKMNETDMFLIIGKDNLKFNHKSSNCSMRIQDYKDKSK